MSSLYIVRHGQASLFAKDYDVLTDLGVLQSRLLGRRLADQGVTLDEIYCGPRARHAGTARYIAEGARQHGGRYPEPRVLDELDEFPAFELGDRCIPELEVRDPQFAALNARGPEVQDDPRERFRWMRSVLWAVVRRWADNELDLGPLESFRGFVGRVESTLDRIMTREGRGRRVAIITSAGPVAMAVRHALGLSDGASARLIFSVTNTSITEIRYRAREVSLISFNAVPHLERSDQITFG